MNVKVYAYIGAQPFSVLNSNRKASFNTRPVSWEDCSVVAINSLKYDMESSSNPNVICISRCPSRSNNMGDSIISPACIEDWFSKISSESRLGFLEKTFPILSFNCFCQMDVTKPNRLAGYFSDLFPIVTNVYSLFSCH